MEFFPLRREIRNQESMNFVNPCNIPQTEISKEECLAKKELALMEAIFALQKNVNMPFYQDSDGKHYVVTKRDGNVVLTERVPTIESDGPNSGHQEKILHQFVSKGAIDFFERKNLVVDSDLPCEDFLSVYIKIRETLQPLLDDITSSRYSDDPYHIETPVYRLFKQIRQQAEVIKPLAEFLSSQKPVGINHCDMELALSLCKNQYILDRNDLYGASEPLKLEACLTNILAGHHLLLFKPETAVNHYSYESEEVAQLLHFLGAHFEGDTIYFDGISCAHSEHPGLQASLKQIICLIRSIPSLKTIRFSNCIFTREIVEAIADGIGDSASIESVTFENCKLDDNHVIYMVNAFRNNPQLKDVRLPKNNFSVDGALHLIKENKFATLSIYENAINLNDIPIIWDALMDNTTLTALNFYIMHPNSYRTIVLPADFMLWLQAKILENKVAGRANVQPRS